MYDVKTKNDLHLYIFTAHESICIHILIHIHIHIHIYIYIYIQIRNSHFAIRIEVHRLIRLASHCISLIYLSTFDSLRL